MKKINVGQLVKLIDWHTADLQLYNSPELHNMDKHLVTGLLKHSSVALVIAVTPSDSRVVYVMGDTGGGWVERGCLTLVEK